MHPYLKISLKLLVAFAVIFFLVQPFNWYCQLTQKCQPFYLTYYFPKKEGTQTITAFISGQSRFRDIDFVSDRYAVETVANRKNIVKFTLKNNSKKITYVFPKMTVNPPSAKDYIINYECPCFQSFRLKPKEVLIVNYEFEFNDKIENDEEIRRIEEEVGGVQIDFKL